MKKILSIILSIFMTLNSSFMMVSADKVNENIVSFPQAQSDKEDGFVYLLDEPDQEESWAECQAGQRGSLYYMYAVRNNAEGKVSPNYCFLRIDMKGYSFLEANSNFNELYKSDYGYMIAYQGKKVRLRFTDENITSINIENYDLTKDEIDKLLVYYTFNAPQKMIIYGTEGENYLARIYDTKSGQFSDQKFSLENINDLIAENEVYIFVVGNFVSLNYQDWKQVNPDEKIKLLEFNLNNLSFESARRSAYNNIYVHDQSKAYIFIYGTTNVDAYKVIIYKNGIYQEDIKTISEMNRDYDGWRIYVAGDYVASNLKKWDSPLSITSERVVKLGEPVISKDQINLNLPNGYEITTFEWQNKYGQKINTFGYEENKLVMEINYPEDTYYFLPTYFTSKNISTNLTSAKVSGNSDDILAELTTATIKKFEVPFSCSPQGIYVEITTDLGPEPIKPSKWSKMNSATKEISLESNDAIYFDDVVLFASKKLDDAGFDDYDSITVVYGYNGQDYKTIVNDGGVWKQGSTDFSHLKSQSTSKYVYVVGSCNDGTQPFAKNISLKMNKSFEPGLKISDLDISNETTGVTIIDWRVLDNVGNKVTKTLTDGLYDIQVFLMVQNDQLRFDVENGQYTRSVKLNNVETDLKKVGENKGDFEVEQNNITNSLLAEWIINIYRPKISSITITDLPTYYLNGELNSEAKTITDGINTIETKLSMAESRAYIWLGKDASYDFFQDIDTHINGISGLDSEIIHLTDAMLSTCYGEMFPEANVGDIVIRYLVTDIKGLSIPVTENIDLTLSGINDGDLKSSAQLSGGNNDVYETKLVKITKGGLDFTKFEKGQEYTMEVTLTLKDPILNKFSYSEGANKSAYNGNISVNRNIVNEDEYDIGHLEGMTFEDAALAEANNHSVDFIKFTHTFLVHEDEGKIEALLKHKENKTFVLEVSSPRISDEFIAQYRIKDNDLNWGTWIDANNIPSSTEANPIHTVEETVEGILDGYSIQFRVKRINGFNYYESNILKYVESPDPTITTISELKLNKIPTNYKDSSIVGELEISTNNVNIDKHDLLSNSGLSNVIYEISVKDGYKFNDNVNIVMPLGLEDKLVSYQISEDHKKMTLRLSVVELFYITVYPKEDKNIYKISDVEYGSNIVNVFETRRERTKDAYAGYVVDGIYSDNLFKNKISLSETLKANKDLYLHYEEVLPELIISEQEKEKIINELLQGKYEIQDTTVDYLNGKDIDVKATAKKLDNIAGKELQAFEEASPQTTYVGFYDVNLNIYVNDTIVGRITNLNSSYALIGWDISKMNILKDYDSISYTLANIHDGVTSAVKEDSVSGEIVYFKHKTFSKYAFGLIRTYNAKVTFSVINGTWKDGTQVEKIKDLVSDHAAWTLPSSDVPTGMIANENCSNGHWIVTPSTEVDGIKEKVTSYVYKFDSDIEPKTINVTFKVVNGKFLDETTEKVVPLTSTTKKWTLPSTSIPTMTALPGYKNGSWDVEPNTSQDGLTKDVTYTYTFAPQEKKYVNVTFEVKNGTWADGTTQRKVITLESYTNSWTLNEEDIPTGMKGNEGYEYSGWVVKPITNVGGIKESVTYKYRFSETPLNEASVTFKVVNGTWEDGSTKNIVRKLSSSTGSWTLDSKLVPTGMKGLEGYTKGSWDVTPNVTTNGITKDVTYTYTFVKTEKVKTKVTFKIVNGKWADGTTAEKVVTLEAYEKKWTLNSSDVPQNMTAEPEYKYGAWDKTPDTSKGGITQDTTYTYTFSKTPIKTEDEKSKDPTVKPVNTGVNL